MALPQGDFSRLLRELRGAGPVDALRLLARSLSALRGLSPWDRKVLLRMAGFEGAEALVERLAGGDRETAEALTRLLAELEEHPDDLERAVRKLGDPRRRGEAVDELLATLDRAAAAEGEGPPAEPAVVEEVVPPPSPPSAPPPASLAEPEPPAPAAPVTDPAPPAPGARAADVAPPSPQEPPAAAEPRLPEPGPASPEPRDHRPAAVEAAPQEVEHTRPPMARAPVEPIEPALPPEAPSAVATLEALLELRRRLDLGRPPDAGELRRLLDREMPFPWARRRAIQAWIEAGGGEELDEVLELVATLPEGPDRAWSLATLAGARPWNAEAWRRIGEAAASPAKRRHLELRRRRS